MNNKIFTDEQLKSLQSMYRLLKDSNTLEQMSVVLKIPISILVPLGSGNIGQIHTIEGSIQLLAYVSPCSIFAKRILKKGVRIAVTTSGCVDIFERASAHPDIEKEALEKGLKIAISTKECMNIRQKASKYPQIRFDARAKGLEIAATVADAVDILKESRPDSDIALRAMEKALGFAMDDKGYDYIYDATPSGSVHEKNVLKQHLAFTTTIVGCMKVFKKSELYPDIQSDALAKYLKLAITVSECVSVLMAIDENRRYKKNISIAQSVLEKIVYLQQNTKDPKPLDQQSTDFLMLRIFQKICAVVSPKEPTTQDAIFIFGPHL